MPRKRTIAARSSLAGDIEAIRPIIRAGIPWQPQETHFEATRGLTMGQRSLLGHLTPFKGAAKFLVELDAETIKAAKIALKTDIEQAEKNSGATPRARG